MDDSLPGLANTVCGRTAAGGFAAGLTFSHRAYIPLLQALWPYYSYAYGMRQHSACVIAVHRTAWLSVPRGLRRSAANVLRGIPTAIPLPLVATLYSETLCIFMPVYRAVIRTAIRILYARIWVCWWNVCGI